MTGRGIRDELGLSDAEYAEWLELSEHRCWICGEPESIEGRRLAVDHDHRTGATRGLLCTRCNRRLGGTVDPEWLRRAAEYLEVAARAYGDNCRVCGHAAESTFVRRDDRYGRDDSRVVFEHACCGNQWTMSYSTSYMGVPCAWHMGARPIPPPRPPLRDPLTIGHPGKRGCPCRECEREPIGGAS